MLLTYVMKAVSLHENFQYFKLSTHSTKFTYTEMSMELMLQVITMDVMFKTSTHCLNYLSSRILRKFNILTSSQSGKSILMKLHIRKS